MCLLGSCKSYKNVGIGEFLYVETILFLLQPKYVSFYLILSNNYAEVGNCISNIENVLVEIIGDVK